MKKNKNSITLNNSTRDLDNCTFVKTILMIIIVFYHSILFWKNDWFIQIGQPVYQAPAMRVAAIWLSTFHTQTFTLVSGYIYYFLKFERNRYDKRKSFILNKTKRLLVPYLFVSVIWVVPFYELFSGSTPAELFFKYALGESPSQLWFLLMLFNVFLIVDVLSPFVFRNIWIGSSIVLVLYLTGLVGDHFLPNYFQIFTAFKYFAFFYIGALFRKYDLLSKIHFKSILFGTIVNVGLFLLYIYYIDNKEPLINKLIYSSTGFLLNTSGSAICFWLFQKIADKINYRQSKAFGALSKNSMGIYLFHEQIMYFSVFYLNGVVGPYTNAAVNFIVSLILSLAISNAMLKYKPTRFLIGENK